MEKPTISLSFYCTDGPKISIAEITPLLANKGQTVAFSCSARGQPFPTFTWFKDGLKVSDLRQWNITSITNAHDGNYHCVAWNTLETAQSPQMNVKVRCMSIQYFTQFGVFSYLLYYVTKLLVNKKIIKNNSLPCFMRDCYCNEFFISIIFVSDKPEVEITGSSSGVFKEGDTLSLSCTVQRSEPWPSSYTWYKNRNLFVSSKFIYVERLQPEDEGSYTCAANNIVGTGTSPSLQISVQCKVSVTPVSHSCIFDIMKIEIFSSDFFSDRPRRTTIITNANVKVGQHLMLSCVTEANPYPLSYSWYRYENKTQNTKLRMQEIRKTLHFSQLQRADEACYTCSATNAISTGEQSEPVCIQVHCKYFGYWEMFYNMFNSSMSSLSKNMI